MNDIRWLNPHQPQTLYIAVILCYVDAVFGLLRFGLHPIGLVIIAGLAAGGFGIANEKKWGYTVAVVAAIMQVVLYMLVFGGLSSLNNVSVLIGFMFDAALVALLLHPQSRDYQRIWFR